MLVNKLPNELRSAMATADTRSFCFSKRAVADALAHSGELFVRMYIVHMLHSAPLVHHDNAGLPASASRDYFLPN